LPGPGYLGRWRSPGAIARSVRLQAERGLALRTALQVEQAATPDYRAMFREVEQRLGRPGARPRQQAVPPRFEPPAIPSAISEIPSPLGPGFRQGRGRTGNIWEQAARLTPLTPGLGGLPTPRFLEEVQRQREATRPPTALELGQAAITPMVPQLGELAGRIPVVGPEARLAANFLTSPLGIASAGIAPGLTAAGLGGQAILGTAGGLAEQAGAPVAERPFGLPFDIGPRGVGEVVGGFAGPGTFTRPGRALVGRGAQAVERAAPTVRRAVQSEIGGVAPALAGQRAALLAENRLLKTLVQESRATPQQEARLIQVRNEIADLSTERGGGRIPRKPAPEGALLTNDIPNSAVIQKRLREVESQLKKPRVANRKGLVAERAKLQAQADIDALTGSGRPLLEQLEDVNAELEAMQTELQYRSVPFRGRRDYPGFVPSKGIEGGARRAEHIRPPSKAYPDLTSAELDAREQVYREFSRNAKFEPVGGAPVERLNLEGERIPTFATEAELQGYRASQGRLAMGVGEQPIETAGPMFAKPLPSEGGAVPPREPPPAAAAAQPPEPPFRPRTMREAEAEVGRVPPDVMADLRGPPPETRVPVEDWETVQARWGNRFQENWWTQVEDRIKFTARTPGEKAVRNTMVTRDLYEGTQKGAATNALNDWAGQHTKTLGLSEDGYARAVQVVDDVPENVRGGIDDIIEHPESYALTPEQQAAINELRDIQEQALQITLRAGIPFSDLVENYAPHVVTKLPKKILRGSMPFPRVTPGAAARRAFPDVRELRAWAEKAGAKVAAPMDAMRSRLYAGIEATANRKAIDQIKAMGYTVREMMPAQLADELGEARGAFKTARQAAVRKGAGVTEREAFAQAEARLIAAKRAWNIHGERLKPQKGAFGRIYTGEAEDVTEALSRYTGVLPAGTFDDVLRLARFNMVGFDAGSALIQNHVTFFRNPVAWLAGMAKGGQAAVRENPYGFVSRHLDAVTSGTKYGAIVPPSEFLLSEGGQLAQRLGRAPGFKQAQRFFEWDVFAAQTLRWEAVMNSVKDPEQLLDLASVLRKEAGSALMPGLTKRQARVLANGFFAPKFFAAMQGALLDPLTKTGPARIEAIRSVGSMLGGATALTVGLNVVLNGKMPNMTDPSAEGWMGVKVGGTWVYPLGPFHPVLRALAQTAQAGAELAEGKAPSARQLYAWPRFAEGRLNVGPRLVVRAMEAMGVPVAALRGRPYDEPKISGAEGWWNFVKDYLPIGPTQTAEGFIEGQFGAAAEIIGGRTSPVSETFKTEEKFGVNPWEVRDQLESMPKYDGIDSDRLAEVQDAARQVRDLQEALKQRAVQRGIDPGPLTFTKVAMLMIEKGDLDKPLGVDTIKVETGDMPLNRERLKLALKNQEALAELAPWVLEEVLPIDIRRRFLKPEVLKALR